MVEGVVVIKEEVVVEVLVVEGGAGVDTIQIKHLNKLLAMVRPWNTRLTKSVIFSSKEQLVEVEINAGILVIVLLNVIVLHELIEQRLF